MRKTNLREKAYEAIEQTEKYEDISAYQSALVEVGKAQTYALLAVAEALGELDDIGNQLTRCANEVGQLNIFVSELPEVRWKTDAS